MLPTQVTTVQQLSQRLRAMNLVGCAFDGFWHPEHPKMTIHVAGDEVAKLAPAAARE